MLTTNVPAPWIVALSSVWLPFLNSSVVPAARFQTPLALVLLAPCISIVPALTLTVPVLLNKASTVVTVFAVLL